MSSQRAAPKGEMKGGLDIKGEGKGWHHKGRGKRWYGAPHTKGHEKGDHKVKGKGKSVNGACNSCGVWGHMTRDCCYGKGAVQGVGDTQNEHFEP